ncbi:MAG TPA: hypothetical protein VJ725_26170 [Thermoanaerobaculia bacterium]|nr:hypothetical protein [Thermoanaerobaculia bacterium]
MRGASISGRPWLFVLVAVLASWPAFAQKKHTSSPHQPTHQYLAGEAFELLRHDPASPSEMVAELASYIGPKVVDWCYWRNAGDRFNVTYGGKENNSQPDSKETRCSAGGNQFVVPYADYTAADWRDEDDNNGETVGTEGNDIIEGTHEEDQYDPLRQVYFTGLESVCSFFNRHFWEPDDYNFGVFDTGLSVCPLLPADALGSAVNKAELYWTRAKTEYLLGNKDLAYHYLGRVVHLLEDLSSTPHTHNDPHPPPVNDDEFEEYMGRKDGDWDRNPATGEVAAGRRGFDNNYIRWGWDHISNASVKLTPTDPDNLSQKIHDEWYGIKFQHRGQDNGWPAWAFGKAQPNPAEARRQLNLRSRLFRLFYSLAETTDDFPSDSRDGDDRRYDRDNDGFDIVEDDVLEYADTILPAAISHIAGLYRLFWSETHFPAPPSAMLLLLDRTGSMSLAIRPATGNTRCRDALTIARQDARSFFASGGSKAAVWSFSGDGIENLTGGFVSEAAVMAVLDSLPPEGCDGSTPLAEAICAASDELAAKFPEAPHGGRLLAISSDGGENDSSGQCEGPESLSGPPYDPGSWQQKVRDKVIRQSTVISRFWNSLQKRSFDVETGNAKPEDSDLDFFTELAKTSGGVATTADDVGAFPPAFTPVPQDPSCATGIALDDGSFENAFASSDTFSGAVQYAMRFNTGGPTALKSVCVCFSQRNHAAALPFTLAVLDDNGAQGSPGTTLAEVEAFAASVPTFPSVGFYRVDLRGVATDGSFFLGPRWAPNQSQTKFWVCADTTGGKKLPAYVRFNQEPWDNLASFASYSALGIRTQPSCVPDATTLCLNGGRFKVQAGFKNGSGTGLGHAVALTRDTGYFWFFDPNNVEMVTKVLTGCGANQRFWVFAGGLTDLETALTVTDTVTGVVRTYRNPQGTAFRPIQDTGAFDTCAAASPASFESESAPPALPLFAPAPAKAPCADTPTSLCLNGGRFRVSATWRTGAGSSGAGQAVRLTGDTGYFWFFDRENLEVVVKTLNACALNNRFWVFGAGLTSVRTEITVEDTTTGAVKKYTNPLNTPFQPIQDTQAFATCP